MYNTLRYFVFNYYHCVSVLTGVDNDLSRGKHLKGQVQSTNKEQKFGRHFDSETQIRSWAEIHQALEYRQ